MMIHIFQKGVFTMVKKLKVGGITLTVLFTAASLLAGIPTEGIVAQYMFSGNIADSSGNGNKGRQRTVSATKTGRTGSTEAPVASSLTARTGCLRAITRKASPCGSSPVRYLQQAT
jgi:hypothetical protein